MISNSRMPRAVDFTVVPVFKAEQIAKARNLLERRMLWKFADRREDTADEATGSTRIIPPGFAGALVLDGEPEPFRVIWNEGEWDCDCAEAGQNNPCDHLAAVLLRLGASGDILCPDLLEEVPAPEESPDDARSTLNNTQFSLDLDPEEHGLFFYEPETSPSKDAIVLGYREEVDHSLHHPTRGDIFPVVLFRDANRRVWRIAASEVNEKDDGSYGSPFQSRHHRPADFPLHPQAEDGFIPRREAADFIIESLNHGRLLVDPKGKPWKYITGGRVRVAFDAQLSSAGEETLFAPVVQITIRETDGNTKNFAGGVLSRDSSLLVLDHDAHTVALSDKIENALGFIRLILSRPVLSASDIKARLDRGRGTVDGIEIVLPEFNDNLTVLNPRLILDIVGRGTHTDFRVRFRYGNALVSPADRSDIVAETTAVGGSGPTGLRNRKAEADLVSGAEQILSDALSWKRGRYAILTGDPDIPLRMEIPFSEVLNRFAGPLLNAEVEIRLENRPLRLGGSLQVNAGRNGMNLEMKAGINLGQGDISSLDLDSYVDRGLARTGEGYFQLSEKALDQLAFLRKHGMDDRGFLTTSPDNLSLIDAVYAHIEADEGTAMDLERKRSAYMSLAEFVPDGAAPPPEVFKAKLRNYQFHGYAWLLHLRSLNLGACIADDMGLGKTIQTLAYLSKLKADRILGPSLLVGPVVTLSNWIAEIERFAPSLSVHRYSGAPEKRYIPGTSAGTDLVIVSYQTLRNDAEKFLDREWDHVILDEAHYVKNASSRTFKTVRSLKARYRISLTGTPLENRLGELWSQMSFLNPGLLGSQHHFDRVYTRPAERDGDQGALERLSGVVAPFILRRRKEDVLDDLPPKEEIVLRCEMTEEQGAAYRAMSELYLQQVSGLLSEEGLENSRIQIFTLLSKLRLLAIHPVLAGEEFSGIRSGKMAALDGLLEEILEEDHKVLVFSQFLGALDRAEQSCIERHWDFSRLTGSTTDRDTPINRFRDDPDVRIFLLSLRAGGVGINLTAADYVLLLDPWWNPAVEAQAIDRAHRMGQKRSVSAYKLITAGTIEEKVLELQKRKKNLVAGALGDGGTPNLNEEEILNLINHEVSA